MIDSDEDEGGVGGAFMRGTFRLIGLVAVLFLGWLVLALTCGSPHQKSVQPNTPVPVTMAPVADSPKHFC